MLKLFITLSAQTTADVAKTMCGWGNAEITKEGKQQMLQLSRALVCHPIDAVYASDLIRAYRTACTIYPKKPITDHRLRERDIGAWEGLSLQELQNRYPHATSDMDMEKWIHIQPPGGENLFQVQDRVKDFLATMPREGSYLIVAHQDILRILTCLLFHLPDKAYWNFNFEQGKYSLYENHTGIWTMVKMNS